MTTIINVRQTSEHFVARARGFKTTASSRRDAGETALLAVRRLADRLADGRPLELKRVTDFSYIVDIDLEAQHKPSIDPNHYRVAEVHRTSHPRSFVIKQFPSWAKAGEFFTIRSVAEWLNQRGVDITKVEIISSYPRQIVAEHLADAESPA